MSDIIHLLPDSVANQIAAGEVIQRPASVIKELVENALDAGATDIQIVLKDAGRTLIQVIDNGKGMSATDARLAFERHATSKIRSAEDLFALKTMGFRGEALASIAAIAQVELKTRREEDEMGTHIFIAGSMVEDQSVISCAVGSQFLVKNIFYNVPARRKFLKSNNVEWNNILTEIERIALVNQQVSFKVVHNDVIAINLVASSMRQRIVNLMGKNLNQQLIPVEVATSVVSVSGFVGKPDSAKKRASQFFFVNDRYMRHPYFHKAVMTCYEQLLSAGENPPYFLYFKVDPSTIDVNIHPTKTEIKFENEQPIWQIIMAAVREALGKHNAVPSIDFDTEGAPDIPIYIESSDGAMPQQPSVHYNTSYNPFKSNPSANYPSRGTSNSNWEKLYQDFEMGSRLNSSDMESETISNLRQPETIESVSLLTTPMGQNIESKLNAASNFEFLSSVGNRGETQNITVTSSGTIEKSMPMFESKANDAPDESRQLIQVKGKYILTSSKSGLMMIDQRRAHIRVMYDQFIQNIQHKKNASQGVLFPEMIQLTTSEASVMAILNDDLHLLGFEIGDLGNNTFSINAVPAGIEGKDFVGLLHNMLFNAIQSGCDVKEEIHRMMALSLAETSAIQYGKYMNEDEMQSLINQLFNCSSHSYTPDGKTIIVILGNDELERRFR